jgi:hypothetical protein
MMLGDLLDLGDGTMSVNEAPEQADLPSLTRRQVRGIFRPWMPDVRRQIFRDNVGIQEQDLPLVLILRLPPAME